MKKYLGLVISIVFLGIIGIGILSGPNFKFAAAERREAAPEKTFQYGKKTTPKNPQLEIQRENINAPTNNLRVTKLEIRLPEKIKYFTRKVPLAFSCVIRNDSPIVIKNIKSVLRTNKGSIASSTRTMLEAGEEFTITGEFTPTEKGMFFGACRTDIDEKLTEKTELDNKQTVAMYVR